MQKMNIYRKHKGLMLCYELLVENGRQLTNCGRVVEERSNSLWKRDIIASKKLLKEVRKFGNFSFYG